MTTTIYSPDPKTYKQRRLISDAIYSLEPFIPQLYLALKFKNQDAENAENARKLPINWHTEISIYTAMIFSIDLTDLVDIEKFEVCMSQKDFDAYLINSVILNPTCPKNMYDKVYKIVKTKRLKEMIASAILVRADVLYRLIGYDHLCKISLELLGVPFIDVVLANLSYNIIFDGELYKHIWYNFIRGGVKTDKVSKTECNSIDVMRYFTPYEVFSECKGTTAAEIATLIVYPITILYEGTDAEINDFLNSSKAHLRKSMGKYYINTRRCPERVNLTTDFAYYFCCLAYENVDPYLMHDALKTVIHDAEYTLHDKFYERHDIRFRASYPKDEYLPGVVINVKGVRKVYRIHESQCHPVVIGKYSGYDYSIKNTVNGKIFGTGIDPNVKHIGRNDNSHYIIDIMGIDNSYQTYQICLDRIDIYENYYREALKMKKILVNHMPLEFVKEIIAANYGDAIADLVFS